MYPLKFEPIFKTIVWGGEKIAPYKGVETEQEPPTRAWKPNRSTSAKAGNCPA